MKQFYKLKNLLNLSFLFIVLFSVISVVNSCKDDDDDENKHKDHLVRFEAKGTTGAVFSAVATQVGTNPKTIFNPTGITWTGDEMFVNSSQSQLNLAANAVLPNADSKLIVNIWVDGEVAKSDTVIGSGMKSAATSYSFLEL